LIASETNAEVQRDQIAIRMSADVEASDDILPLSQIGCRTRLDGLLKHYYRKAA
jgi:hypothetical protein